MKIVEVNKTIAANSGAIKQASLYLLRYLGVQPGLASDVLILSWKEGVAYRLESSPEQFNTSKLRSCVESITIDEKESIV